MNCKICNSESSELFKGKILSKYDVQYFQCNSCKFIQTEEPYWLEEAYSEPIPDVDVGYVIRNIFYSDRVSSIIKSSFNAKSRFVDYGGGYGMFTRIMRDKGFEFYRQDSYCENFFANHFDVNDINQTNNFEALTAFEVFEHLVDPIAEIEQMFNYSDTIIFSTNLQPNTAFKSTDDWWYFSIEKGQHIALFHLDTLHFLEKKFNCNLYTNNETFHILSKKKLSGNPIKKASRKSGVLDRILKRNFSNKNSLIQKDYAYVKSLYEKKKG